MAKKRTTFPLVAGFIARGAVPGETKRGRPRRARGDEAGFRNSVEPLPETSLSPKRGEAAGGEKKVLARAAALVRAAGGFGVTAHELALLASCARGDGGGAAEVAEWIASRDLVGRKRRLDADAKARARREARASTFFFRKGEKNARKTRKKTRKKMSRRRSNERASSSGARFRTRGVRATSVERPRRTTSKKECPAATSPCSPPSSTAAATKTTTTRFGTLRTPSGSGRRRGGSARTRARGGRRTRSALRQTLKTLKTLNRYLTREPRFETERARGARRRPTRRGRRFWRAGPTLPRRRLKNERITPGGGRRRPRRGEKSARLFVSSRG